MNKYGKLIDANTIQFKRVLPGPIELVWSYLVESKKRAAWLASGNTELNAGGTVEFIFNNGELSKLPDVSPADKYQDLPETVSFVGKVTHCTPPTKLRFIWPGEGEDSEVTFELEDRGSEVLITVTHTRIIKRDDLLSTSAGWHTHLDILVDILNHREPQPFWSTHNTLEHEYEEIIHAMEE